MDANRLVDVFSITLLTYTTFTKSLVPVVREAADVRVQRRVAQCRAVTVSKFRYHRSYLRRLKKPGQFLAFIKHHIIEGFRTPVVWSVSKFDISFLIDTIP
jgi:hypothetical protein